MQKEIIHNKNISFQNLNYRLTSLEEKNVKNVERIHERIDSLENVTSNAITKQDLKNWFIGGLGIMGVFVSIISTFSNLYISSQIKEANEPMQEKIINIEKELIKMNAVYETNSQYIQRGN